MKDDFSDGNAPLPDQPSRKGKPGVSRNADKSVVHAAGKSVHQLFRNTGNPADSSSGGVDDQPGTRRPTRAGNWHGDRPDGADVGFYTSGAEFDDADDFFETGNPDTVLTAFPAKTPYKDQWNALRLTITDMRQHFLAGTPLVDYYRSDPAAIAIDKLRTRLIQTLRDNNWNRVAVVAPTKGCGTTFMAVNLAQSLARVPNSRNVLMDVNNRAPGIAGMLEIEGAGDIRSYLAGDVSMVRHLVRVSETLAVGLTCRADPDAAEMLLDVRCGPTLDRMNAALRPDVILYDLPPMLAYDDLVAFLPHVDAVLLVADGTQTQGRQIRECKRMLKGKTELLGVVLNRTRILDKVGDEAISH